VGGSGREDPLVPPPPQALATHRPPRRRAACGHYVWGSAGADGGLGRRRTRGMEACTSTVAGAPSDRGLVYPTSRLCRMCAPRSACGDHVSSSPIAFRPFSRPQCVHLPCWRAYLGSCFLGAWLSLALPATSNCSLFIFLCPCSSAGNLCGGSRMPPHSAHACLPPVVSLRPVMRSVSQRAHACAVVPPPGLCLLCDCCCCLAG
jgi:hypothetical protein